MQREAASAQDGSRTFHFTPPCHITCVAPDGRSLETRFARIVVDSPAGELGRYVATEHRGTRWVSTALSSYWPSKVHSGSTFPIQTPWRSRRHDSSPTISASAS